MPPKSKLGKARWALSHKKELAQFVRDGYDTEIREAQRKVEIAQQTEIIRNSAYFNADWYAKNHLELQNADVDLARDYLLNGLVYRNPSPQFCSQEYWHLHPEVEEQRINPLLHFEQFGKINGFHIHDQSDAASHDMKASMEEGQASADLKAHRKNLAAVEQALRERVQNGDLIRAVFFVSNAAMFSLGPLFRSMLSDDLFGARIVIIPDFRKPNYSAEMSRCEVELLRADYPKSAITQARGDAPSSWEDVCKNADIVAYDSPYYGITSFRYSPYYSIGRSFLPIIANYTYPQSLYSRKILALDAYAYMWKVFLECPETLGEYKDHSPINGENASLVGYTKMDSLSKFKKTPMPRKQILVALHHSIDGGFNADFNVANFIRYFDYFCGLPDKYPEIDFVYRPHPFLFDALRNAEGWSAEKLDAYISMMERKPNFRWSIGGEYMQEFVNSDACIQDCGSFQIEYFYTGNPCCYMLKEPSDIESKFSPLGREGLGQYYLSYTTDDIDKFITQVVIGELDEKAAGRKAFASRVMFNYPHAADAALEDIKASILGASATD